MDATLIKKNPPSIFRGDPSPEVDAAWARISNLQPIVISREDVVAAGADPNEAVKFDESFNVGSEAYAGRIDVFHQIHCLDTLRRDVYFDHYYKDMWLGGLNSSIEMHQLHVSHCIYYLLQSIMCNADVNVYTHYWTDTFTEPIADFEINHQCRDFDAILNWQEKTSLDMKKFKSMTRPEGAPIQRMSRKFKEVHGYYHAHPDRINEESGSKIG